MKAISPTLLAFLEENDAFFRVDLLYLQLMNGQVIAAVMGSEVTINSFGYYSGSPPTLTYPNTEYYPTKYGTWERGKVTTEATFVPKSHSMELTLAAPITVLFPGTTTPIMQMVTSGLFDSALATVFTIYGSLDTGLFATDPSGEYSAIVTFKGKIASYKPAGRSKVKFNVVDMLYLLNYDTPPNLIQSGCRFNLFDQGCTLVKSSFSFATSYASGGTGYGTTMTLAGNPSSASWWNAYMTTQQGTILFTSGLNEGLLYYIKQQVSLSPYVVVLSQPLLFQATGGDEVLVYPGCAKTIDACSLQYDNLIHIGAAPFVPNPEQAL